MPTPAELGIIPVEAEPMPSRYALVIPGQGGLEVGIGKKEYETSSAARGTFDFADSYLTAYGRPSVTKLCFEGPIEELSKTENAHLALTTMAYAKYRALEDREDFRKPVAIAPQSAAECAGIAIAGVVPFDVALEIASARGVFTAEAGRNHPGQMLWLTDIPGGLEALDDYIEKARNGGVLSVSNINADNEFVISGDNGSIENLMRNLGNAPRRTKLMGISFASHCRLMDEAEEKFVGYLNGIDFADADIPIIINGDILVKGEEIKRKMSAGLTRPVLWPDTVRTLDKNNVHSMIELVTNVDGKPRLTRSTKNILGLSADFLTSAI